MQNLQASFSQQSIDMLFASAYFVDKFQELQIQTYNDLMQVQSLKHVHSLNPPTATIQNESHAPPATKANEIVSVEELTIEIGDLLSKHLKQAIFKQSNDLNQQKLSILTLTQEIENIKQTLNKMGQASSFALSAKTLATQESLTPDKHPCKQTIKLDGKNADTSMFIGDEDQSSIEWGTSRKNLAEDRISSLSFMNSFLNENKMSAQEEEIINERINASISKIQSSIDDRISQLEKEFTRRIQQIMRTIKHLIQMINENEETGHLSPFSKNNKKSSLQMEQPNALGKVLAKPLEISRIISSKSTIILPQKKQTEKQMKTSKKSQDLSSVEVKGGVNSQAPQKQANKASKLVSFFGIGRLNTSQK